MKARDGLSAYLSGVSNEDRDKERAEILGCTNEKLRELADYVERLLSGDYICAIGNAGMIDRDSAEFGRTRELYI